jgi:hypothetical protein
LQHDYRLEQKSMNPIRWQRHLQVALLLGAAIGGCIGIIIGFFANQPEYSRDYTQPFLYWVIGPYAFSSMWSYDGSSAEWFCFGALIGLAVVYVRCLSVRTLA